METTFDINTLPVKITYMCEAKDGEWSHDAWRVELSGKQGYWSTTYKTGLGHRSKPKASWDTAKPKKPAIADVMHSLLTDADVSNDNFHDFCDNFGYSNDSIIALNTYKACLETATALRKYIPRETLDLVREAVKDM